MREGEGCWRVAETGTFAEGERLEGGAFPRLPGRVAWRM